MRDRLIELYKKIEKEPAITCPAYKTDKTCKDCQYSINDSLCNHIERQVDYLLANGVVVLPCKVGDRMYCDGELFADHCKGEIMSFPVDIIITEVCSTHRGEIDMVFDFKRFGKDVFLTREEAERALKGGE